MSQTDPDILVAKCPGLGWDIIGSKCPEERRDFLKVKCPSLHWDISWLRLEHGEEAMESIMMKGAYDTQGSMNV